MPARADNSQPPISTTKMATRSATMVLRRRISGGRTRRSPACARGLLSTGVGTVVETETFDDMTLFSSGSGDRRKRRAGGAGMGTLDLVAQRVPDLLIQRDEARVEADLGHLPRPREVDVIDLLDRARPRGHDDDAVRERDRLLEVMRDEEHR